jgi:hypothetical protein
MFEFKAETPKAFLGLMKGLLQDEKHWSRHSGSGLSWGYRGDLSDIGIKMDDPNYCLCVMNAFGIVMDLTNPRKGMLNEVDTHLDNALAMFNRQPGRGNVVTFNDDPTTTHPMILQLLDKAIELSDQQ